MNFKEYITILDIKWKSVNPCYIMAGPPNEYRILRTINTLLISGAGFSVAAKARKNKIKKKEVNKKEIMGNHGYVE